MGIVQYISCIPPNDLGRYLGLYMRRLSTRGLLSLKTSIGCGAAFQMGDPLDEFLLGSRFSSSANACLKEVDSSDLCPEPACGKLRHSGMMDSC